MWQSGQYQSQCLIRNLKMNFITSLINKVKNLFSVAENNPGEIAMVRVRQDRYTAYPYTRTFLDIGVAHHVSIQLPDWSFDSAKKKVNNYISSTRLRDIEAVGVTITTRAFWIHQKTKDVVLRYRGNNNNNHTCRI